MRLIAAIVDPRLRPGGAGGERELTPNLGMQGTQPGAALAAALMLGSKVICVRSSPSMNRFMTPSCENALRKFKRQSRFHRTWFGFGPMAG
jgi:hypothetical protein